MRKEKELTEDVNVTRARQHAGRRNGTSGSLQEIVLEHEANQPDSPFPYLEKISVTAKKNPYAMLTIIISIASVIIIAVTTLSVSVIGSVFVMYGKMNTIETQQQVIIEAQNENKQELKVLRTYEASVLSRQNYAVGLMDKGQQERMNAYDRANPIPRPPNKEQ